MLNKHGLTQKLYFANAIYLLIVYRSGSTKNYHMLFAFHCLSPWFVFVAVKHNYTSNLIVFIMALNTCMHKLGYIYVFLYFIQKINTKRNTLKPFDANHKRSL